MKNLMIVFLMLFFASIVNAFTPHTAWLTLQGPEDNYLVVVDGTDIVNVTGPAGTEALIANDFDGDTDAVILTNLPPTPSRVLVWLNPWQGRLQGWLSTDRNPEMWQELALFASGFTRPVRPEPLYQPQFAVVATTTGNPVAVQAMAVAPSGKLTTTWGKIKKMER